MATSQVIQTSSLPAAFETFYTTGAEGQKGLIPQAFNLYGQGTPAAFKSTYIDPLQAAGLYSGQQRVAGLTPTQQQIGTELQQMTTPSQFQMGTGALGSAYGIAGAGLPSLMNAQTTQQFMSPYMQNVVDVQQQQAVRDAQQTQLAQNLGAARQGTYGGARQLLATTERERNLGDQLAKLQATGLQSAYEAAQKGIEAERAAQLQQAQTLGQLGSQFGQLGVAQQASDIDRLKTLGAYGDLERAVQQQRTDIDYQNLMQQINYPETQLEKLSAYIRGVPLTDTTQTTTTPPPSFASQLAGLGLSGLSLYNLLGSKG
jgi:hypothetical protein